MARFRAILGVGGGIAAYKSAELVRSLQERDFLVQAVLTDAAQQFIRPLTFAALTGQKVITGMFDSAAGGDVLASSVEHIGVARGHDLLIVAPATADLLAKFAHGLAGDFLSTLHLAFTGPVLLAPAMNTAMWQHRATQANLETLLQRGARTVGPDAGSLACGETGAGRMAEPDAIAEAALRLLTARHDLDHETILITAGPTQEPIDPVRYITNRSSGKMGYALAEAALARGARVILISGPVHLRPPAGVELVSVRTAQQMYDAVMAHLDRASIVVKTAAVADFHVASVPDHKIKKTAMRMSLELAPTADILAEVGRRKKDQLLVGFAAETDNLAAEARRKLESKNCDLLVANLVGHDGTGFESDNNEVLVALRTGESVRIDLAPKRDIADRIFDLALQVRLALHSSR